MPAAAGHDRKAPPFAFFRSITAHLHLHPPPTFSGPPPPLERIRLSTRGREERPETGKGKPLDRSKLTRPSRPVKPWDGSRRFRTPYLSNQARRSSARGYRSLIPQPTEWPPCLERSGTVAHRESHVECCRSLKARSRNPEPSRRVGYFPLPPGVDDSGGRARPGMPEPIAATQGEGA